MKLILKILAAPVTMLISLFAWICAGLISCSTIVFKLASGLIALMALAVLFTYSVQNGIILLVIAFLVSPLGLPMLAVKMLGGLQSVNGSLKGFIHN